MASKAVLEIEGKKYNILEFNYKLTQESARNGYPCGNVSGGHIIMVLESDKDIETFDWAKSNHMQKQGTISFYNHDGMSVFKKLSFREAYCLHFKEEFNSNGKLAMRHTIEISPGDANYDDTHFTKNWSEPVFDLKNANTFVKEEEDKEKKITINFKPNDIDIDNARFGYDNFDDYDGKCTSDTAKLKQEYKPIQVYGKEYVPIWLSMRKGQKITLNLKISRDKNKDLFNEIKFVDHPDFTFEPANLKDKKEVQITCNNNNASTAQIKVEGDGVVVGAINFFYAVPKIVDLRWIIVNFNEGDISIVKTEIISKSVLDDYFNKAFNQSLIDINIVNPTEEVLDLTKKVTEELELKFIAGIRTHIQENTKDLAKNEVKQRAMLMSELNSLHTLRKNEAKQNEVTLLLTNLRCLIPAGDDDFGSNNGITLGGVSLMFLGNKEKFPKREIPHEIMHGIGLQHTFKEDKDTIGNKKHTYQKSGTLNFMDYDVKQSKTFYWQWEELHNSTYSK